MSTAPVASPFRGPSPARTKRRRRAVAALLLGLLAAVGGVSGAAPKPVVYAVPVEGVIDLGLAPFLGRVLAEAEAGGAAALVLEINTFGGRLDAAVLIRDALLGARLPTAAFVNRRAISAGALIGLACEKLYVAEGATIGAATPVEAGEGQAQPVTEKTVSYVRKEFRATAESRGRPPLVAEAMVDADVEVPGLVEKGKLLTLTAEEALAQGVADLRADTLEEVLGHLGLAGAEVRRPGFTWAERLVRFLTNPVVSSLLMSLGVLGILVEIRTPGFGVPGLVGVASLALFFWGHWLVQLAGWEELLLAATGVLLVALEVFVFPGFGVAGVLGIAALVAGLGFTLVGEGASWAALGGAVGRVALSLLIAAGAGLALLRVFPRLPFGRRLVLATELPAAPEDRRWLGARGVTRSPLRPAGIAEIDGERVDVVSEGDLIDAGEPVEVVRVEGNRVVVRRRRPPDEGSER